MDKFTLVSILLLIPMLGNDLFCQTVEVLGQLKVSTVNLNNAATDVLVRNADGSIAKRDVATIGGASQISDADNNTKVTTEKNANEDVIRFDLGGSEKLVLNKNGQGTARLELKNVSNSTFIGDSCGFYGWASGLSNTALGYKAHFLNESGDFNTVVGREALRSNGFNSNTAIGYRTLYANTSSVPNTAIGFEAMSAGQTAAYSTAVGYRAYYSGNGQYNTAIGQETLYSNTNFGEYNVAVGVEALYSNTDADHNTAIGSYALRSNTFGGANTGVGSGALRFNNSGYNNVALGNEALYINQSGEGNTAVGTVALRDNNSGNTNVAVGKESLMKTTGSTNTGIGAFSLRNNTNGFGNTAVGHGALYNTNAGQNTGVGIDALNNNTSGTQNTAIGYNANVSAGSLTNATAIGAQATVSASNSLVLGNNANVGIGINAPTSKLHVIGDGVFSGTLTASCGVLTCSDVRYKKNIVPITNALSSIILLNGVRYNLKAEEFQERQFTNKPQIGLLAQDVEMIYPEVVFTDQNGYKAIDYSKLTPVLIEAIKELKDELKDLKEQVAKLKNNQQD